MGGGGGGRGGVRRCKEYITVTAELMVVKLQVIAWL